MSKMHKRWKLRRVQKATGLDRWTICEKVALGEFPKPFNTVEGVRDWSGWCSSDVEKWIEDRNFKLLKRHDIHLKSDHEVTKK